MSFRTEYSPEKAPFSLHPTKPVVLLGSCFAENISGKMHESLWDACNPLGTLYNPLSISRALKVMLVSHFPERDYEKSLFLTDDKYYSWLFDSKFSAYSAVDSIAKFNKERSSLQEKLIKGQTLIITFGTSRAYFLNSDDTAPVGNCHKQPATKFHNRRLSGEEIVKDWTALIKTLKSSFPELKIIFTVSPVRHLKDGFHGNSLSKAVLLLAVEQLCDSFDFCHYFPAYEIVNDDLRDYRFYASDMVHPSEMAVAYIWEIFTKIYLDEKGRTLLSKVEKIYKALNHRQLPDASVLIPDTILERRRQRNEEIIEEYKNLQIENPGLLPLEFIVKE